VLNKVKRSLTTLPITKIYEYPIDLVRNYSIPCGAEEMWDRGRAAVVPFTYFPAVLYLFGYLEFANYTTDTLWFVCYASWALAVPLSAWVTLRTNQSKPPPGLLTTYAIFGFFMCFAWVQLCAQMLVDIVQLYGFVTGLPKSFLFFTIMSWGNGMNDFSADPQMTRLGFGEMAVTAAISGPIFNSIFGNGISQFFTLFNTKEGMFTKT